MFIITLHVIFYDLEQKLLNQGLLNRINTVIDQLWDLEYADDTILFGRSLQFVQAGLFGLQDESELYGLFLNKAKCAIMTYEQRKDNSMIQNDFRFKFGQKVKQTNKYI